jgi:choline dehydrogenase-like flavoprotein
MNPLYDYLLSSEGEKHLNNKKVYLIRGKMVGGSSAINVLIYHRGSARDYDAHWPEGWKSKDNLDFFKKFERYESKLIGNNSKYHGYDGELQVEDVNYQNELSDAFINSAVQFGMERNSDFNDWSHEQAGVGKFQVTTRNGRREDGYTAFLADAPNSLVRVLTGVTVSRIVMTDQNSARGVLFTDEKGNTHTARVKEGGEVILSAGAIMSPEILLASGIGPTEALSAKNIPTRVNSPGVGKNLQDHPSISLQYNVAKNVSITNEMFMTGTSIPDPMSSLDWLINGRGPLASPGCEQGAFLKTREGLSDPDVQIRVVPARGTDPDAVKTYTNLGKMPPAQSGIALQIIAVRPASTGSVTLRGDSTSQKPVIDLNYLSAPVDRETLRAGIRLARQIVAQPSLQKYVLDEVWPGKDVQTDEELDRYINETTHTANALVGTCKMGMAEDKDAVVDTSLRVIGAQNLRVVDASVFPKLPGGQTAAPTYMVAEKAANLILRE